MYHRGMQANTYLKNRPCIYGIRNLVNNKIYVGKTKCIYKRCAQYIYDFKWRKIGHLNDYLYHAMVKVGLHNFDMFPIEFVELENLTERELYWIKFFDSINRDKGYNIRMDSSEGMIVSEETSIKISSNLTKQWASGVRDGHSQKMIESWSNDNQRKELQSKLLSRIKTKYEYEITHPNKFVEIGNYVRLNELGLKNAVGNFSRTSADWVNCKGFIVKRKNIKD